MAFRKYDSSSKEDLTLAVEDWSKATYGSRFSFRPHQKETIVGILYDWFNGTSNVILSAPTGSGKSFIAMTAAGVAAELFGKRGYILISDLSLLAQYERDVELYFPDWGVIRGKQNYKCIVNNLAFPSGVCQIKNCKSYGDIEANFPDCAPFCEYICIRNKAMISPVVVCTYSFWLMHQNLVKVVNEDYSPFDGRDFVICDEAHNLVDIVQHHFSPRFGSEDMKKFELLINEINDIRSMTKIDFDEFTKVRLAVEEATDKEELYKHLCRYRTFLSAIYGGINEVRNEISIEAKDSSSGNISADNRTLLRICDFAEEHVSTFTEYLKIIENIGSTYIIKDDSDASKGIIIFNCLDESYLMRDKFHCHCSRKLYMSATIGNPNTFAKNIGAIKYTSYVLPAVFDYSKSPIYFVPDFKLSYKEKEYSFPYILKMAENIIKMYTGKRGIIQTGSYSVSKMVYDQIDPSIRKRLLLYDGSAEKRESIEQFKYSKDKILVGPSLVEGLSLDDDLCRFLIMMKVPYPSLASKYVAAKSKFDPYWYNETTAISVLQGVGRGVRNENDWCVTFILDGCFNNILNTTRYMLPNEFTSRIQGLNGSYLLNLQIDNK